MPQLGLSRYGRCPRVVRRAIWKHLPLQNRLQAIWLPDTNNNKMSTGYKRDLLDISRIYQILTWSTIYNRDLPDINVVFRSQLWSTGYISAFYKMQLAWEISRYVLKTKHFIVSLLLSVLINKSKIRGKRNIDYPKYVQLRLESG